MGGGLELLGVSGAVALVVAAVYLIARADSLRRSERAGAERARLEAATAGEAAQEAQGEAFDRARGRMLQRALDRLRRALAALAEKEK